MCSATRPGGLLSEPSCLAHPPAGCRFFREQAFAVGVVVDVEVAVASTACFANLEVRRAGVSIALIALMVAPVATEVAGGILLQSGRTRPWPHGPDRSLTVRNPLNQTIKDETRAKQKAKLQQR